MALAAQATTKAKKLPSVLPPARAAALFEEAARRVVGMPGAEFLAKWEAGEYRDLDDTPENREIAYLALLIPFGRRHP